MFLYDIVQAYVKSDSCWDSSLNPYDETLEQLWNAQEAPKDYDDILVYTRRVWIYGATTIW